MNTKFEKQYLSLVPGSSWSRFGPLFPMAIYTFLACAPDFGVSFAISFCSAPQFYMRIRILNGRASEQNRGKKFGRSYGCQCCDGKLRVFCKNHDFMILTQISESQIVDIRFIALNILRMHFSIMIFMFLFQKIRKSENLVCVRQFISLVKLWFHEFRTIGRLCYGLCIQCLKNKE